MENTGTRNEISASRFPGNRERTPRSLKSRSKPSWPNADGKSSRPEITKRTSLRWRGSGARGRAKLFFRSEVFVGVFRQEDQIPYQREEQFYYGHGAVSGSDKESFDIDNEALSEFRLFETPDPRVFVRWIGRSVDFVLLRAVDFRYFEFQFLQSGFGELANLLNEPEYFPKHVVGNFLRQLRLGLETSFKFVETFRNLDFLGQREDFFFREARSEAFHRIDDAGFQIFLFAFFQNAGVRFRSLRQFFGTVVPFFFRHGRVGLFDR